MKQKQTYLNDDAFIEEWMLFGRHDEVVRLVLVVHDIFQVNTRGTVQLFEEFLIEDECHTTNLFYSRFRLTLPVYQIRRDGNS